MSVRHHADIEDSDGCGKSDSGIVVRRNRGKRRDGRPSPPCDRQEYRARHADGWATSVDHISLCIPRRADAQSRLNSPRQLSHELVDALNRVDFGRLGQMGVSRGGLQGAVTQPLLNVTDIDSRFQQMGCP